MTEPRASSAAPQAVLVVLTTLLASTMLLLPWGRDQGTYAHAAQRLLDGYVPYRDTFVFKPPMTVFVHATSQLLFGTDFTAIRVLDVFWTVFTALVVFELVRLATERPWLGTLAGLAYAAQYTQQGWWETAQTDGWMALPAALALWLAIDKRDDATPVLAGVLLVVAALFKYTALAAAPFVALLYLCRGREGLRPLGLALAGGVGAVVVFVVAMVATGAWAPFLDLQLQVVLPYTGAGQNSIRQTDWPTMGSRLWKYNGTLLPLGALGLATVVVQAWSNGWRSPPVTVRAGIAASGWFLAGLISGLAQKKGFEYHFLFLEGGSAAAAGIAIGGLSLLAARLHRAAAWGPPLLAAAGLTWWLYTGPLPKRVERISRIANTGLTLKSTFRTFKTRDLYLSDAMQIADQVAARTPPDSKLLMWGYDPMIYVLADRDMAGRFNCTMPLMMATWGSQDVYRKELMQDLRATPPGAILLGKRDRVPFVLGHKKSSLEALPEFPALQTFLHRRYERVKQTGGYELWLPKDRSDRPVPPPSL